VLLVGLGRATRLLQFLTRLPKTYTGEVVLGAATTTLDDGGEVTDTWDMAVSAEQVQVAAQGLTGAILQVPPMVSAVRVGGRRLHELAREGVEVEREPRPVTVYGFTTSPTDDALTYRLEVTCSSGTYVRVLAADLGARLGGGAHLRNLRRTAIGSFGVDLARGLPELEADPAVAVLPPAGALIDYVATRPPADVLAQVVHGRPLPAGTLQVTGDGPWAVLDADGELLAVYERRARDDLLYPAVVIV
jgi:tRNA pseudouridine55 synthase